MNIHFIKQRFTEIILGQIPLIRIVLIFNDYIQVLRPSLYYMVYILQELINILMVKIAWQGKRCARSRNVLRHACTLPATHLRECCSLDSLFTSAT